MQATVARKSSRAIEKTIGSDAHNVLGACNESGDVMVDGALTQLAMNGDEYSSLLVQNYLAVEGQMVA